MVYLVQGEFYIVNGKWLRERGKIARAGGSGGEVFIHIVLVLQTLLDKTKGHSLAI